MFFDCQLFCFFCSGYKEIVGKLLKRNRREVAMHYEKMKVSRPRIEILSTRIPDFIPYYDPSKFAPNMVSVGCNEGFWFEEFLKGFRKFGKHGCLDRGLRPEFGLVWDSVPARPIQKSKFQSPEPSGDRGRYLKCYRVICSFSFIFLNFIFVLILCFCFRSLM